MTLEQQLLTTLRILPLERQQEVLDFAEFLTQRHLPPLEQILTDIRRRAQEYDPIELDALVEDARQDFADFHSQ